MEIRYSLSMFLTKQFTNYFDYAADLWMLIYAGLKGRLFFTIAEMM